MVADFRRLNKSTAQKHQRCPFRLMKCGGELMADLPCVSPPHRTVCTGRVSLGTSRLNWEFSKAQFCDCVDAV